MNINKVAVCCWKRDCRYFTDIKGMVFGTCTRTDITVGYLWVGRPSKAEDTTCLYAGSEEEENAKRQSIERVKEHERTFWEKVKAEG